MSQTDAGAIFSPCRCYRYRLWRDWGDPNLRVTFVMLNPSTADAEHDDPTVRRCGALAAHWGFGALDVVNLFAWCATRPSRLTQVGPRRAVGSRNDRELGASVDRAARVVLAWGSHRALKEAIERRAMVIRDVVLARGPAIDPARDIGHLGRNQDGSPKHPLYLPNTTRFVSVPCHDPGAWPVARALTTRPRPARQGRPFNRRLGIAL